MTSIAASTGLNEIQRIARCVPGNHIERFVRHCGKFELYTRIKEENSALDKQSCLLLALKEVRGGSCQKLTTVDWTVLRIGKVVREADVKDTTLREAVLAFFRERGHQLPQKEYVNSLLADVQLLSLLAALSDDQVNMIQEAREARAKFLPAVSEVGEAAKAISSPPRRSAQLSQHLPPLQEEQGMVQHESVGKGGLNKSEGGERGMGEDSVVADETAPGSTDAPAGGLMDDDTGEMEMVTPAKGVRAYQGGYSPRDLPSDDDGMASWGASPTLPTGGFQPGRPAAGGGRQHEDIMAALERIEAKLDARIEGVATKLDTMGQNHETRIQRLEQIITAQQQQIEEQNAQIHALQVRQDQVELTQGQTEFTAEDRDRILTHEADIAWLCEQNRRVHKMDQICLFQKEFRRETTAQTVKAALQNAARDQGLCIENGMIHKIYKLNSQGLWGVKFHDRTFAFWAVANKAALQHYGFTPSHDKTKEQNQTQTSQKAELQRRFPDKQSCPIFMYTETENIRILLDGQFKTYKKAMEYIESAQPGDVEAEVRAYKEQGNRSNKKPRGAVIPGMAAGNHNAGAAPHAMGWRGNAVRGGYGQYPNAR